MAFGDTEILDASDDKSMMRAEVQTTDEWSDILSHGFLDGHWWNDHNTVEKHLVLTAIADMSTFLSVLASTLDSCDPTISRDLQIRHELLTGEHPVRELNEFYSSSANLAIPIVEAWGIAVTKEQDQ